MRALRVLMFLLRLIFGVTFILSGFFKLTDPVGTGLIVEEYLRTMHMGFLSAQCRSEWPFRFWSF